MCPDRQMLSLYVDDEIPSPWKEKLEAHLATCAACSRAVDEYRELSAVIGAVPADGLENARARVWKGLAARTPVSSVRSPWSRRIVLPVPAAVAALLAVAVLAAGGVGLASSSLGSEPVAVVPNPQNIAVPVSDIGSVLRYLDSQESSAEIVIIRLPEAASYESAGRPTLIRAADYNGRPSD